MEERMENGTIYRGFDIARGDDGLVHIVKDGIWVAKSASEEEAMNEVDRLRRNAAAAKGAV
jgi:hypothetical protein